MEKYNLKHILSSINTYEAFEQFKLKVEFLESMAKEIIARYQFPEAPILF